MVIQEPEFVQAIIQERQRQAAEGARRREAEALQGEAKRPRSVISWLRTARTSVHSCMAFGSRTL